MQSHYPQFTVAEYFAGIGLVRMGLQPHGWKIVFANDIATKKYEMYREFFSDGDSHFVVDDIFNLNPGQIPTTTLATCSFPCTDLSLAGNMNGLEYGHHSSAFWGFTKILHSQGSSAPPLVLIENVPGWLYSNDGQDFRITVQSLNKLGYSCDVFNLDALRFTPQSRQRVFIVGAKFVPTLASSEPLLKRTQALLSPRLRQSIIANNDLDWFYNDIPEPPPANKRGLSNIIELLHEHDERWWSETEIKRHLNMMKPLHRDRVEQLSRSQQTHYRTFFRRRRDGLQRAEVRNDELSGCLRTAVGGSGKQFLVEMGCGRIRMRAMTPREYARLQGVPDNYPIRINGVQALTGFGDAVCVPVISWIAKHVLNPLSEKLLLPTN